MDNENVNRVFSQQLIWQKLGKYLEPNDFLSLRLVNRLFCTQINDCIHFQDKIWATILIKHHQPDECFLQQDVLRQLGIRNIKVVFAHKSDDTFRLTEGCKPIPTSEFLNERTNRVKLTQFSNTYSEELDFVKSLRGPYSIKLCFETTKGKNWFRPPIVPLETLAKILNPVPNIKSMSLNGYMISEFFDKHAEFFNDDIWKKFSKLEELTIYKSSKCEEYLPQQNLRQVLTLLLTSLKFNRFSKISLTALLKARTAQEPILATLQNSVPKLHTLELNQIDFWSGAAAGLENISFPQLECLLIRASYDQKDILEKFLANQPMLTSVHLEWIDYFPGCVYDVLSRKSALLRKIYIKAKSFGPEEETGDWNFLSGLQFLEDFQIVVCDAEVRNSRLSTYNEILRYLPKSTVRRIHIENLEYGRPLDMEQLLQFRQLNELSVLECEVAITNDVFRRICLNDDFQQNLTVLEISNCSRLTDYGLNSDGNPGSSGQVLLPGSADAGEFSLNNLKALQRLTIKSCRNFDDESLAAIRLPNLKHLDVSSNPAFGRRAVLNVVRNNSKLETIRGSWKEPEKKFNRKELMKGFFPSSVQWDMDDYEEESDSD